MFPHAASPNTSLQEILTASQTTKTSENLWTFTVHRLFSRAFSRCSLQTPLPSRSVSSRIQAGPHGSMQPRFPLTSCTGLALKLGLHFAFGF